MKREVKKLSLEKSKNALIILNLIAEKGPKTLYEILKEKGMRRSSIHLALNTLSDQNLIIFDVKESEKRNRNQRVYSLTFKGLVVFLSKYHIPEYQVPGRGYRFRELFETDEEAKLKFIEKLKKEWPIYKPELDKFSMILQKNGELLGYPLFQHCKSFQNAPSLIPELYQNFIKIAQDVIREFSSKRLFISADQLRKEKKKLEKSLKNTKKLFKGQKMIITSGFGDNRKVELFDPVANKEQILDYTKDNLRIFFDNENEGLKESFFMKFLNWHSHITGLNHFKFSNKDLFGYAESLLKKEKKRFNYVEKLLDKWLIVFSTP